MQGERPFCSPHSFPKDMCSRGLVLDKENLFLMAILTPLSIIILGGDRVNMIRKIGIVGLGYVGCRQHWHSITRISMFRGDISDRVIDYLKKELALIDQTDNLHIPNDSEDGIARPITTYWKIVK